jgi:hypothetical protein
MPLKTSLRLDLKMRAIWALGFVILPTIVLLPQRLCAQEIRLRLLDGRNGRPIERSCIDVWIGDQQKSVLTVPTDQRGIAKLRLTANANEVNVSDHWEQCGAFGVRNPTVKYSDIVRVHVGYVWCSAAPQANSWWAINIFSTTRLISDGEVTPNACGKVEAVPVPGELTIFIRPLTFWEKLKQ